MKDALEVLANIATFLGIPIAILVFIVEKLRERKLEELDAHQQSNDRYVQYLERCLATDDYSACEFRPDDEEVKTSGLSCRELVSYTILVSMMETGYLRYKAVRSATKRDTWTGWVDYIRDWAKREDFRKAWPLVSPQFDVEFVKFASRLVADAARSSEQQRGA